LLAKKKYHWSIEVLTFGTGFEYFIYVMRKGENLSLQDQKIEENSYSTSLHSTIPTVEEDSEDFLYSINA